MLNAIKAWLSQGVVVFVNIPKVGLSNLQVDYARSHKDGNEILFGIVGNPGSLQVSTDAVKVDSTRPREVVLTVRPKPGNRHQPINLAHH